MIMKNYTNDYINTISNGLKNMICTDNEKELDADLAIEKWVDMTHALRDKRGIFFFAGNGASATMAEHFSHDCFQNGDMLTETCSETSHLTAISNDLSYEDVFSYRISKLCTENDMLITISSSGNSKNIIKAIEAAKNKRMFIVTLSGKSKDNRSRQMGNLNFYVPLDTYGTVESAHATLMHCWLDMFLDKYGEGRH